MQSAGEEHYYLTEKMITAVAVPFLRKTKGPSNLWQHTGGFFQARSDWSILMPNRCLKGLSTGKDSRHSVPKSKVTVSWHLIVTEKELTLHRLGEQMWSNPFLLSAQPLRILFLQHSIAGFAAVLEGISVKHLAVMHLQGKFALCRNPCSVQRMPSGWSDCMGALLQLCNCM